MVIWERTFWNWIINSRGNLDDQSRDNLGLCIMLRLFGLFGVHSFLCELFWCLQSGSLASFTHQLLKSRNRKEVSLFCHAWETHTSILDQMLFWAQSIESLFVFLHSLWFVCKWMRHLMFVSLLFICYFNLSQFWVGVCVLTYQLPNTTATLCLVTCRAISITYLFWNSLIIQ